ncbi:hypothetical protein L9F63_024220 [Diploptera punctata]|uniref:Peptidase S1 domain-containing protein n=1 Tax=Diploptera punctata TaxID=6984 RepID=A0AAD7ZHT8_DIPPU|nr:hypothetical protein L9F63_024220 [Diploptera punctata]
MTGLLFVFALLIAGLQAESEVGSLDVVPRNAYMNVLEDAPEVVVAPKIVNGQQATRGQFPYQAALYLDGSSFCGGSLISTTWVLTAAHCAQSISRFTVYLGAQALSATESGRVVVTSTTKVVHSGYSTSTLNNDIALVRLPSAVSLTQFIQTVALPSSAMASNTFAGQTITVSGWGRISDSTSGISNNLNYINLPVITNSVCQLYYSSSIIVSSTICADGAGGRSTCNGDSGGPMVLSINGVTTQIGVVSFVSSRGCGSGYPSGYVRVTSFLSWISSNTGISIS